MAILRSVIAAAVVPVLLASWAVGASAASTVVPAATANPLTLQGEIDGPQVPFRTTAPGSAVELRVTGHADQWITVGAQDLVVSTGVPVDLRVARADDGSTVALSWWRDQTVSDGDRELDVRLPDEGEYLVRLEPTDNATLSGTLGAYSAKTGALTLNGD